MSRRISLPSLRHRLASSDTEMMAVRRDDVEAIVRALEAAFEWMGEPDEEWYRYNESAADVWRTLAAFDFGTGETWYFAPDPRLHDGAQATTRMTEHKKRPSLRDAESARLPAIANYGEDT